MIASRASSRGSSASTTSSATFAITTSVGRQIVDERVGAIGRQVDAVRVRVQVCDLDCVLLVVDGDDRPEPELLGGDREHAGAAPDVEQARRLELLEQVEAQPRRRVRAGAECAARIDHDRREALGRLLPRRPDPEAADDDAVVELAPRLLPPFGEGRRADLEELAERALAGVVGVDGEAAVDLLDADGKDVEQLRELELATGDEDASQRNALFSFSKNPSSAL